MKLDTLLVKDFCGLLAVQEYAAIEGVLSEYWEWHCCWDGCTNSATQNSEANVSVAERLEILKPDRQNAVLLEI